MENYLQYKKQTAKVQRYFRKGNAQEIRIFASTLQKWAEWKKKIGIFFVHGSTHGSMDFSTNYFPPSQKMEQKLMTK